MLADIDLDQEHYEAWLSVNGAAEFRYLWPKERRPVLYRDIIQDK